MQIWPHASFFSSMKTESVRIAVKRNPRASSFPLIISESCSFITFSLSVLCLTSEFKPRYLKPIKAIFSLKTQNLSS